MKVSWKVTSIPKMNLKISVTTEQYHIVQKSTHSWFLASTEAVWGLANTFGMSIIWNYQGNAHTKFFWLNFVFLETYEHDYMHFSLNSAPCTYELNSQHFYRHFTESTIESLKNATQTTAPKWREMFVKIQKTST